MLNGYASNWKRGYVKLIMFYDPNQQYEKQKILMKK